MSEETNSSATVSETEKPETTSATARKPGKKLWMMIAAVIVAILLVSTALFFLVLGVKTEPALTATITPSPARVNAGTSVELQVTYKSGDTTLADKDVKLRWSVEPNIMGTFDFFTKSKVNLAASSVQQNGTLKCSVDYKGKTALATAPLQILPAGLDRVSVSPSEMWVRFNSSQEFTAKGVSTIGQNITGLSFNWIASGLTPSDYTITRLNDTTVRFTAKAVAGNVTLNATTTYKTTERTGSATAKVTEFLPTRTVDYRWYDAFKVPFGPWYPRRTLYYPGVDYEGVWSNTYPYIYKYYGDAAHENLYLYSNMRLNITAVNLPNVNMSHPEFLPMFGSTRGGHAVLNWHMQYLDPALVAATYGSAATAYNDGWFINLTGVTTLDKDAAMAVTGMTATEFDNFDTYWSTKGLTLRSAWQQWLIEDQANGAFDVNNMYATPAQMIGFGLHAQKVGDKIVLTVYADTWGMEALMTRWLRDAFVPTEVWMEGFWMNATIGPQTSNIFIKTDVEYSVYAFMSRNDGNPVWLWKPLHQDYQLSSASHRTSEFDPYAKTLNPDTGKPYTYINKNPGSALFNTNVSYDVTPCAWNLSENETMSFTWPAGMQQFEMDAGSGHVTNISKDMAISYAEPMPGDYYSTYLKNGSIDLDTTSRMLTYTGPIDFWHWSQMQNASNHQALRQQWIDIDGRLLPESVPWVEFGIAGTIAPPHIDHFVISGVDDLPVANQTTSLTVTAYDQYSRMFDGTYGNYTGTVHFGSNKSSSVTLPPDYQFTVGDHGVKTFTNGVTFTAVGWFTVNVADTLNASASGSYTEIMVIPTPQMIDHFTVTLPNTIVALSGADVTVTAWNQYGRIFHEYTGTVNLTTNASAGTYKLPDNTTFLLSWGGVHKFSGGAIWDDAGTYDLTVMDTTVKTANGTKTGILVTGGSEIRYRIYNMFEDHWMPFWKWRYKTYQTDIILSDTPGNYTMLYNPDKNGFQGIIYGPYRMNITAKNLTNVNVHHPEFMPVLDSNRTFAAANATVEVYFQYLYYSWWNNTWVAKWSSQPNFYSSSMADQRADGWWLGVQYNVTMNRETAQEWMRLPITATDVAAWWAANVTSYKTQWGNWLLNEENVRLDVYNAYEFPGSVIGPYAKLVELPNGDVRLELDHVSWAYEIVMARWLLETQISTHQPYYENFTMSAKFDDKKANLTLDTICQYSMHAVKANKSAGAGSAWVIEAIRADYVAPSFLHPKSDFAPYVKLTYTSWNAGDPYFSTENGYDVTPGWLNLTKSQTLVIELPKHDQVIAYVGKGVGPEAINNISYFGDYREYNDITRHGNMSLGYYMTNLAPESGPGLDLNSMYDAVNKTLTIKGPHQFDNSGFGWGKPMYHGAPWIEFNVTYSGSTVFITSAPTPSTVDYGSAVASEPGTVAEITALMALVSASLASIAVLAIGLRRKDE